MRWSHVLFCFLIVMCGGLAQADDDGATVPEGPIEESIVQPTVVVTAEPTQESTEQFTEQIEEIFEPPAEELFAEPTTKITQEPTLEVTAEPTTEITIEPTIEVTVEPTVSPQEPITEEVSNTTGLDESPTSTTGTDDSTGEEVNVTVPLESLTGETGNETPSLTLDGGPDESDNTNSSPGPDGVSLAASTNLTTSLRSSPRMFSSSLSSISPESGTSPVVTLGTIVVTGTLGTKLSSAGGSGYSYNSADGGYFIITSGGDYYLDEDISTSHSFAIEIQASDVTLDGNGHTITYTGSDNSGTSGVLIDPGASGTTVENFAGITGFEHGISAYGEDAVIENNTVYGNDYGIYSDKSDATIFDNDASRNVYGIWSSGDHANITDNIACFNNNTTLTVVGTNSWEVTGGYGIYSSGDYATIAGNNASFNSVNASREVTGMIIENYKVNATGGYGIYSTGSDAIIRDNTANNNSATAILNVDADAPSDAHVYSNSASATGGYGIQATGTDATITNNTANSNSATAILNADADDDAAHANANSASATGGYGIQVTGNNATITNNTANNNSATAILNADADDDANLHIYARFNSASATGGYGIQVTGNNATITNNTANENSATAILNASASAPGRVAEANANSASATGGYGIQATGTDATINNNTANENSATAILNASADGRGWDYAQGNSASVTGGYGIEAMGNNATITNNTANSNSATAILNASVDAYTDAYAYVNENSASTTGGYGIQATGTNVTITNNTADGNNAAVSATALENGVPVATTTSLTGGFGINSTGDDATITDNRVSGNRYGIGISDAYTGLTLTGNSINQSTEAGLNISEDGGGGTGYIFNNYFGNDLNVCATASSADQYHWNNTEPRLGTKGLTVAAAPGTNVVGGRYLAGNYWSDENGNGWSDQQTPTETGYSLTSYEVVSGVYDQNPLIRTLPTEEPTVSPTPTQTSSPIPGSSTIYTSGTSGDTNYLFSSRTESNPDSTGINFVIVNVTIPKGTIGGDNTRLTVRLKNTGSIQLPPLARIVLEPVNDLAQSLGEQPAVYQDGEYILTFQLPVPTGQGSSVYIFNPIQVTRDPGTGQDIRIPVGGPVQFTVTVGSSGTVTVQSP